MRKPLYDKEELKKRGLETNGYCLPYNPKLTKRANELRQNMTPTERKLWMEFFRGYRYKVSRQKIIDNYIVDFYIAKLNLVIEIDGAIHDTLEAIGYDIERTEVLSSYNLKVLRFRNDQVEKEFNQMCQRIKDYLTVEV
jgi:very-short-patch-repair endonuclease